MLTIKQQSFIKIFLTEKFTSWEAIAKKAGITRQTLWEWRNQEEFAKELEKQTEKLFANESSPIKKIILQNASKNKLMWVRLYCEMMNKVKTFEDQGKTFEVIINDSGKIERKEKK